MVGTLFFEKYLSRIIFLFEAGSCYIGQTGFELVIFLLQPSNFWDYRYLPPHLAQNYLFKQFLKIFCTLDFLSKLYHLEDLNLQKKSNS